MGKRVLIVGLCCLDVVSYLDNFPVEDSDNRVFDSVNLIFCNYLHI